MKTIRVQAWERGEDGALHITPAARRHVPPPQLFKTITMEHETTPPVRVRVDIFQGITPEAIALIPPDAPRWVEDALDHYYDRSGERRQ